MSELASLITLFAAAFGAATLLPFQSEVVFVGMQLRETAPLGLLLFWASLGNVLGSCVNYLIGRFAAQYEDRRWFPVSRHVMARAERWYAKWGYWTLLLSWAPFGDGVTVVAGVLRTRFWLFLLLVTLAKTGRYIVLAWATAQI
ncbi:YqaA family protein [Marinovum sp.]|uniref:YqaA family protein n=1 Tax=Marinovum sp. TaxID=2024839 RepID=UPI002B264B72|nr:YqaA family protein [Marinovum sp.]